MGMEIRLSRLTVPATRHATILPPGRCERRDAAAMQPDSVNFDTLGAHPCLASGPFTHWFLRTKMQIRAMHLRRIATYDASVTSLQSAKFESPAHWD
jgi:hypothetical protein